MRRAASILRDKRGVVLLLVVATVALFTAMVVSFSADEGLDMELAYNFRDSMQAQYIARSGVEAAIALLKKDVNEYDADDEEWGSFAEYAMAASSYMGTVGQTFTGTITDESGRFDLNSMNSEGEQAFRARQFKKLFELLNIDISDGDLNDLATAVKDWIDKDEEPGTSGGAEEDYYQSLEAPYHCKNGPMDCPEEILLVKGMKPEYYYGTENYKGIRDSVTVGTGGKINVNTASDVVLESISEGVSPAVLDKIKAEKPYKEPSSSWSQRLGIGVSGDEMTWINSKVLTNQSTCFRADMKGTMPSGAQVNIRAILKKIQGSVRIVYYKIY